MIEEKYCPVNGKCSCEEGRRNNCECGSPQETYNISPSILHIINIGDQQ